MNTEALTLVNNLETDLAKEYFNILVKYEPEEITSYETEDFEYMILAKDLEGVYEIPEGNIYILRKEWR